MKEIRELKIMNKKALEVANKINWYKHSNFKNDPITLMKMVDLLRSLEHQLEQGVSEIVEEQKERIKK